MIKEYDDIILLFNDLFAYIDKNNIKISDIISKNYSAGFKYGWYCNSTEDAWIIKRISVHKFVLTRNELAKCIENNIYSETGRAKLIHDETIRKEIKRYLKFVAFL